MKDEKGFLNDCISPRRESRNLRGRVEFHDVIVLSFSDEGERAGSECVTCEEY